MIRLSVRFFGRHASLTLEPRWEWSWVCACGCLLVDAGPVSLVCHSRRMRWER